METNQPAHPINTPAHKRRAPAVVAFSSPLPIRRPPITIKMKARTTEAAFTQFCTVFSVARKSPPPVPEAANASEEKVKEKRG